MQVCGGILLMVDEQAAPCKDFVFMSVNCEQLKGKQHHMERQLIYLKRQNQLCVAHSTLLDMKSVHTAPC